MRPMTALLAASTLTFAITTVHFAHQARQAGARDGPAQSQADMPATSRQAPAPGSSGALPDNTSQARPAATPPRQDTPAATARDARAWMAARLQELRDPATRHRAIEAALRSYQLQLRGADKYLRIPPDEFNRLMQVMAETSIERQQQIFACDLDPGCDGSAQRQIVNAAHPLADQLSAEQVQVLQAFQDSQTERRLVENWRTSLTPALAPSENAAVRLALQLAEVRRQFEQDAQQRGEQIVRLSSGIISAARRGSADEHATLRESARQHARRMFDVASTHLTSEQLGGFSAALERATAQSEATLKEREAAAAARNAAGNSSALQR